MNIWTNRNFRPMLLKEIYKPFNDENYIYEMKYDGFRALVFANKKGVYVQSRNIKDITYLYPEMQVIKNIVGKNVIFDGEIICEEDGKPSFEKLQKRSHLKSKDKIKKEMINNPAKFIVFDILYEGRDLTNKSLLERKRILEKYSNNEVFIKTNYIFAKGRELFKEIKKRNLEGIVAKNVNSFYYINKRTDDFIKIKNINRDEFYIGGYIINKNNTLSLLLGEFNNGFNYVGKVIINQDYKLSKRLLKIRKSNNYFNNYSADAIFLKPNIKCFVEYLERTKNGMLRHPKYKNYE